jgi:hypothetical protein
MYAGLHVMCFNCTQAVREAKLYLNTLADHSTVQKCQLKFWENALNNNQKYENRLTNYENLQNHHRASNEAYRHL